MVGQNGRKYTNIIKFLDKVSLSSIADTNGEAWYAEDENEHAYKNFICPTDAQQDEIHPSNGYEIQVFAEDGITPIPFNYGWSFDAFNGILHFSSKFNPKSDDWTFGIPKIEAFIYIGKYTSDTIKSVNEGLLTANNEISRIEDLSIAIQPYKFSTDQMTPIGDPYIKEYTGIRKTVPVYYQKLSYIIPGYCFEISLVDNYGHSETIITEMSHITEKNCKYCTNKSNHEYSSMNFVDEDDEEKFMCHCGDTEIFIDVPWDMNELRPIVYYTTNKPSPSLNNVPVPGRYIFVANCFIRNDGKKINVKKMIDKCPSGEIDTENTEYNYDRGCSTSDYNHNCNCNLGNNVINFNF